METWRLDTDEGERRVFVRFADDEVAEGRTPDLDLERAEFELSFDSPRDNTHSAIVPLASVKRVLLGREEITEPVPDDVLRKVALHFWDGEVVKGLLRRVPERHRNGMTLELLTPEADRAEVYALPYHALKAVFFLRSWDTRPPQLQTTGNQRQWTLPRQDAPLIELLSEIRGLRGLRHRGQISEVEYERRRSRVLAKI
ncbi:MAG: hypothetical protein JF886_01580 [Candidatus Dormibacteraeota bacterium]|uniref:Uncharacterized protein n=1 Tax=Candidatus Aeolococcus gillhamiae TaxID=3127015 RepID=A0A2W5ZDK9_9BACT|nr:hypothetical protein [Candidatus Dormibacteraeota bacterium]PZR83433.1 MAG: hypothetical protein DLM65_01820 [Candidatus Dormibacter sp. RRmetagenome_bin12]